MQSFSIRSESLYLKTLRREPVFRRPAWIMRQAGRYLPEYRAVRQKAGDFMSLCKTPELACEVTLQPLRRYPLDAAIVFSDILTIPDAMGLGLSFIEGEGPMFERPIRTTQQIQQLPLIDVRQELSYVMTTIQYIRRDMPDALPLIGFSGSPWTLACYMTEGRSSRDYLQVMRLLYEDPALLHQLLTRLATVVADYLIAQVEAGVDALMIFDTWGGLLPAFHFESFSCDYLSAIVQQVKKIYPTVPITVFTKGGGQWLSSLVSTGCDGLGLDWTTDIAFARSLVGERVALQGHLDPKVLLMSPETIRRETLSVLEAYGKGPGHVFNLGHGITPEVPPDHVEVLLDTVRSYIL